MTPGEAFLTGLAWFAVALAFLVMLAILATLASLVAYIIRTIIRGVSNEIRDPKSLTAQVRHARSRR